MKAVWKKNGEYDEDFVESDSPSQAKTVLRMSDFSGDDNEHDYFLRYSDSIDELKRDILKHFLLRLWLANNEKRLSLTIMTFVNGNQKDKYSNTSKMICKGKYGDRKDLSRDQKLRNKRLNPTSEQYIARLSELANKLLKMIPQQNKDELARYIIRRDMVVNLLMTCLEQQPCHSKGMA